MTRGPGLEGGLAALGVTLDATRVQRLHELLRLVEKWNKVYNLTAVRNVDDMVAQHVLDSLAVLPHLPAGTLLDIGSGAGFPGIPVAIVQPERPVTLLDSSHKKAAFLRQAVIELSLKNAEIVCARAEKWTPHRLFDVVISRAFAELKHFITVAGRFCAPGGMLAAMKGVYPHDELSAIPPGCEVLAVKRIEVPGLSAERHLVLVQPAAVAAASA